MLRDHSFRKINMAGSTQNLELCTTCLWEGRDITEISTAIPYFGSWKSKMAAAKPEGLIYQLVILNTNEIPTATSMPFRSPKSTVLSQILRKVSGSKKIQDGRR
jgi:hypothetical protein